MVRAIRCVTPDLSLLIAAACCRFPITISLPLGLLTARNNCCHFSSVIAVMSGRDTPSQKNSLKAISRMSPPQAGHSSGNSSPTRAMSFAHACPGSVMRTGFLIRIRVAAAFRGVTAAPMPAGRGLAPLADIPDRERRHGFSQLVIRRKHPVITMPVLPRRNDVIGEVGGRLGHVPTVAGTGGTPRGRHGTGKWTA